MKTTLFFIIILLATNNSSFAQTEKKKLEVYSITEYIDGYVIKGVSENRADTISIISIKEVSRFSKYQKISVGHNYLFEFRNTINSMAAIPNGFSLRIKKTVVWKSGDGIENVPVYAINMKGLWIKE